MPPSSSAPSPVPFSDEKLLQTIGQFAGTGSDFGLPEVAFSSAYRPGFSTYPEGGTFKEIYAVLAKHGSPAWISGEGTNVSEGRGTCRPFEQFGAPWLDGAALGWRRGAAAGLAYAGTLT